MAALIQHAATVAVAPVRPMQNNYLQHSCLCGPSVRPQCSRVRLG